MKTSIELKRYAVALAKELWDVDLNIAVKWGKLKGNRYGEYRMFCLGNGELKPKEIIISNQYDLHKPEHRKQLDSVLKHELCHWYCHISGKQYSDGDKDFEAELLRVGAMSSNFDIFDEKNFERSKQVQMEIVSGERNRLGHRAFKYEEVPLSAEEKKQHYERKYKVWYKGCFIGYVKKWDWGKYRWNPESEYKDYGLLSWTTRKHAVEDMLKVARENGLVD